MYHFSSMVPFQNTLNHESWEKADKSQSRDILYNLISFLKTVIIEIQGEFEKLSQPRRAWGDMTTEYNVISWIRKKTLGKNEENLKVWALVNDNVLVSIH